VNDFDGNEDWLRLVDMKRFYSVLQSSLLSLTPLLSQPVLRHGSDRSGPTPPQANQFGRILYFEKEAFRT